MIFHHLITDTNRFYMSDRSEVWIYREDKWYDEIVIYLKGMEKRFEELKPFIIFVAENLCEMDCIAQRYSALRGDDEFADG